jgi:hypothetical protein
MATLVLTTVGTIVGGPIGGAIGAMIGQRADQLLFAPKPREGPRLGELALQTSSYGSVIPKIFGTMRVAGTVIWSTDLREHRSTSGSGKGQPKTVNYSYSASFAVALSGRPIVGVKRIWADGKLLRGAAGDFKSRTRFRLYRGGEDQPVDPLIASAEGIGQAPAFRGIAYALFEDLALEDFGNRIPSLSFEVEADLGAVPVGAIASELSQGAIGAGATPSLGGYAAMGDSVRAAIEGLADVLPLSLSEDETGVTIGSGISSPITLEEEDQVGRTELSRRGAGKLPRDVTITYYDAARDYQLGLQRAFLLGAGQRSERRELAAVLSAGEAKALAEDRLARLRAAEARGKLKLPWRLAGLRPGTHLRHGSGPDIWRVKRWALGPATVSVELVRVPHGETSAASGATPGRQIGQPDLIPGPTVLRVYDLAFAEEKSTHPLLVAVAAGASEGWRRADLLVSYDHGRSWQAAGATAAPAVMGSAVNALPPGQSALVDDKAIVEVELLNEGMWLESRSDEALVAGANLSIIGDELFQFGKAEPLGQRRFRLSHLLRGRRGTEWAAGAHAAGEPFTLLDSASFALLAPPAEGIGGVVKVRAVGLGDESHPSEAGAAILGSALQPPSPVHLKTQPDGSGGLRIGWVRRSRLGWTWASGTDTPLGEEAEAYRLTLSGPGFERTVTLGTPGYTYTAQERAADGPPGPIEIAVMQIGTFAVSVPARLTLS